MIGKGVDIHTLVAQLQQGNELAFNSIYDEYSERLYINIRRLVKDEDIAKELLQDLFMKVWTVREDLDPEKSFISFLYRIAQNLVTDLYRRAAHDRKLRQHLVIATTELYNPLEEQYNLQGDQSLLKRAIDSLPTQRQKVYSLCKLEGKSYEEVAELMGISTATVRNQIVSANKSLKVFLTNNKVAVVLVISGLIQLFWIVIFLFY